MNIEENKMNIEENKFGLKQFTKEKLKKLEEIPSNLLKLLKSYRGYDDIDNLIDPNKYYLYTGRGTSNNSFHIGHLLGLKLILGLQKVFTDKIYFMISDDEKRRLHTIEPLDEIEEWELLMSHYSLLVGVKGDALSSLIGCLP